VDAPIDLNLLRVFALVGEIGSFANAARKLGLPRSSVSRQIAALEEQVGTSLFNRTTRRVALSTAGAAFYGRLVPQLAALESSLGSLPERDESPSGDLRLSAPPDLGAVVLPEILAGFCARFPGIHLEVSLSPRFVDLVADQFDAAIRVSRSRLADSSLVARKLGTLELDLFASTPRKVTALRDYLLGHIAAHPLTPTQTAA
jgi:DNA-binding transcriptional LysR family regulator